jgi:hypothetical protein
MKIDRDKCWKWKCENKERRNSHAFPCWLAHSVFREGKIKFLKKYRSWQSDKLSKEENAEHNALSEIKVIVPDGCPFLLEYMVDCEDSL